MQNANYEVAAVFNQLHRHSLKRGSSRHPSNQVCQNTFLQFWQLLSYCTGAGLKLRPLELWSRFESGGEEGEGQGLLALARNKNRANLPRKMFKPVLILEMNLLRKVVHNGDSFGWLLIQEWILVLQSFRESSFSGKPASFVTKVAVFYWQACKVSGGGNSATELKPNVKKWKSFLWQKVSGGEFCQGMLVVTECEKWKCFYLQEFWVSATNQWWWWLKLNVKSFVREGKVKQGLVALKDEQQERRRLFSGKKNKSLDAILQMSVWM